MVLSETAETADRKMDFPNGTRVSLTISGRQLVNKTAISIDIDAGILVIQGGRGNHTNLNLAEISKCSFSVPRAYESQIREFVEQISEDWQVQGVVFAADTFREPEPQGVSTSNTNGTPRKPMTEADYFNKQGKSQDGGEVGRNVRKTRQCVLGFDRDRLKRNLGKLNEVIDSDELRYGQEVLLVLKPNNPAQTKDESEMTDEELIARQMEETPTPDFKILNFMGVVQRGVTRVLKLSTLAIDLGKYEIEIDETAARLQPNSTAGSTYTRITMSIPE